MPIDPKPIRSLLFVPGNREDWMREAPKYGSDGLIFDMEGAMPPAELPKGREIVRRVLEETGGSGPQRVVRVSGPASAKNRADLEAIVCAGLNGVMIPQTRGPEDVAAVDTILTELERERGLAEGRIVITPLLESAGAIRQSYEIATASPRIAYLGSGVSRRGDIVRSIGYRWTPEGLESLYFRSKVLLDVRAAGVPYPMSGQWSQIGNLEGLRAFANQTRDLGYVGMTCIHPTHVPILNEVFTPTPEEIESWRKTLVTMEAAWAEGRGAVRFEDGLVDEAHIHTARQGLDFARKLGVIG